MTQLWPEGIPVDVEVHSQRPRAFRWQQRRQVVRAVVDQWIVHDEWWRTPDTVPEVEAWSAEIWRHYFQVETTDGLLCVLYRDVPGDRWYLERVYD